MSRVSNADVWPSRYKTGMWVWVLHRISGVVIALYGIAHLWVISYSRIAGSFDRAMSILQRPYIIALEMLLIAAVLYHILSGLRVILFDLGIGITYQKRLFWGLMVIGAVIMGFAVNALMHLSWDSR